MRVGIDAGPLLGHGGISGYVSPLVHSLLSIDPDTRYHLVLRRGWLAHREAGTLDGLAPVTRVRIPDHLLSLWWDHLGRPLPLQRRLWGSLDLFLATCLVAPVLPQGRVVSIVYDLIPLRLPALFADHRRFRRRVERLLGRSAAVVAISERTKQDLVDLLEADPARVRVIYPGSGEAFRPVPLGKATEVARRLGVRGRYVLYVGALGPHKNVPTLLRAYQRARLEGGLTAQLVVVGSPRWGQETLAVLEGLRVREDILLAGAVAAEDLPALYSAADMFVFPSRYEGFGLPVLEAMACGTPVIVSDRGALPEVAGDAGSYVNPDDEVALAAAMSRVAGESETRARMAAAGLQRASRFSWVRSAEDLLALFREVARAPSGPGLRSGRNGSGRQAGRAPMAPSPPGGLTFYDRDYFEGRTRQSPPHTRELIYPLAERTAAFLCRRRRPVRVLDLGCAKGFLVEAFRAQGVPTALGVDASLYAVSSGGAATRGRLMVGDVQAGIPLRAGSFDLVTGLDLFEHLPDPASALREIRRILSDGGVAYLKICHPRHPNASRDPSHVNVQPLSYWRRQFRQAGFGWERLYESEFTVPRGLSERLKAWVRRCREWAVLGTPADYKFLLWKRAEGANDRRFWDAYWAGQPPTVTAPTMTRVLDRIKLERLRAILPASGRTLEVGSGSGRLSCFLAMAGYRTICLDPSLPALQVARANYAGGRVCGAFVAADGFYLPFSDGRFDVVLSTGLLEHFADPSPIVREMVRVLRAGGVFYSDVVPRKFSLFRSLDWIGRLKRALIARGAPPDTFYERSFTPREIRDLLERCGLVGVTVFPAGVVPPYLPLLSRSPRLREGQVRLVERTQAFWKRLDATPIAAWLGFYYFAWATKP